MRRGIAVRAHAVLACGLLGCAVLAAVTPAGAAPPATDGNAPGGAAPVARVTIDALAWLAGHWRSPAVEEVWLAPRGGLMLAMTREIHGVPDAGAAATTAGGTAPETARPLRVSFEYLRIEQRADGSLVLLASPGGRPPTAFTLVESGAQRVRFANAGHDFPQEILYWREGDTLRARVSGVVDGRPRAIAYAWQREPATGATPLAPVPAPGR